jgi:subtilase family serine protease
MRTSRRVAAIAIAVAAVVGGIAMSGSAAAAPVTPAKISTHHACANSIVGGIHCDAIVLSGSGVTANGIHPNSTTPQGLSPAQLRAAYNLTSNGTAVTVAIVDAFDDPNAEADLGHYRSQFGLPACTTANGCFRKVNQNGGTTPPSSNVGWAEEISLDIDMVSAICPNCHILLVEATSASFANLGAAVNRAATMGAVAISNSYGGSDTRDSSAPFYNHPGIAVTASSGDSGFGAQFPATSHFVTAVGGTHLVMSGNTRVSETVWSGAGSGCSSFNTALTGAASFGTGCSRRAEADVSAVADPATGVSVYDTFGTGTQWLVFGGTSVASPIIASVFALANNSGGSNNYTYNHYSTANFNDITSGNNGSCSPSQLCTARVGWDGPTGLGTPHGLGGF